jgi:hypothetical protein
MVATLRECIAGSMEWSGAAELAAQEIHGQQAKGGDIMLWRHAWGVSLLRRFRPVEGSDGRVGG